MSYTYQHSSIYEWQSCIDRLYVLQGIGLNMYTFTQWCQCSDHSAVISTITKISKEPSQWRLSEDVLDLPQVQNIVTETLLQDTDLSHGLQWEMFKIELCSKIQQLMHFHKVQHKQELKSLQLALRTINRHIYQGEKDLDGDRLKLQPAIHLKEKNQVDLSKWIEQEGTYIALIFFICRTYELVHQVWSLLGIQMGLWSLETVLEVLHDFYQELYSKRQMHTEEEILDFLQSISDIPKISQEKVSNMGKPITEDEIFQNPSET